MIMQYETEAVQIEFGTGDISISMGGEKGCGALMFEQQKPQPTGFPKNLSKIVECNIDEYPVSMLFTNPASIDALIPWLEQAKKILTGEVNMDCEDQEYEK